MFPRSTWLQMKDWVTGYWRPFKLNEWPVRVFIMLIMQVFATNTCMALKAAQSVTFDLLILEKKGFYFQEYTKITQIQVDILPCS